MTAAPEIFRVGISGSYGGLNLGDEAILHSIVSQLRASLPVEITVFSRDAKDTTVRHKVDHVVPVRDLSREEVLPSVQALDLRILGGGGTTGDVEMNWAGAASTGEHTTCPSRGKAGSPDGKYAVRVTKGTSIGFRSRT